jgi:tryptophanyl-tRNA synthetase
VLQAADILVYKATHVPVGEDQKQHLELARDIAAKFNNDFAAPDFFPLPEPLIQGPGARIMSLRDGSAKMSKSDPSDQSRINLTDEPDDRRAEDQARPHRSRTPARHDGGARHPPEARNLIGIYAALADVSDAEVLARFAGQGFGDFKPALAELVVESLRPVGEAMRRYLADPAEIDRILADGAERARAVADPVVAETKRRVGFWSPGA